MSRGATLAAVCASLALGGCDDGRSRLVVRTDLPGELRDAVETAYESAVPEVDVRFADADATDFDVWWGARAARLEEAVRDGTVGSWTPILSTPFVVVFDRTRIAITDAPRDWIDVFHHGWFEDVVMPDPRRVDDYGSFVTGIVADDVRRGEASWIGFEWLGRLDRQIVRYTTDERDALMALRLEQASLAILRGSAVRAAASENEDLHVRPFESGGPVVLRGVGVAARSALQEEAARFVTLVASAETLSEAARLTGWDPVSPDSADAYAERTAIAVDSSSVWLERWSREVRGRGK